MQNLSVSLKPHFSTTVNTSLPYDDGIPAFHGVLARPTMAVRCFWAAEADTETLIARYLLWLEVDMPMVVVNCLLWLRVDMVVLAVACL